MAGAGRPPRMAKRAFEVTRASWSLPAAWWALLTLLLGVPPASAQNLSLQTELDVRATELGTLDGKTALSLRVEPRYQLSWRGPLQGGTRIYADIGSTGGLIADPGVFGSEQDYQLNLHAESDALSVNTTLSRSTDTFSLLQPNGTHTTSGSRVDALTVNAALAYPGYPLLNVQHQRARVSSTSTPATESSATLLSGNYDIGALRLSLDTQWVDAGGAGGSYQNTQYGVNYTTALTPRAQLSAYQYGWFSHTGGATKTSTTNQTTMLRLSALPTPFLVLDGEATQSVSSQSSGSAASVSTSSLTHTVTLRSDPLPGIRMDLTETGTSAQSGGFRLESQQYTANLGIAPAPDTQLVALLSTARFKNTGDVRASRQDQQQVSFIMPLFGAMDLNATYYHALRSQADSSYDNSELSFGAVGALSEQVLATATLRLERQRTRSSVGLDRLTSQSIQLQADWQPNPDWDLTVGLNAVRSRGVRSTTTIQPIVETRWNMTSRTTLTVRYNMQAVHELDQALPGFNGTSSSLNARLTQELSNVESIELSYDDQRLLGGVSRFQRVLELRWLRRF